MLPGKEHPQLGPDLSGFLKEFVPRTLPKTPYLKSISSLSSLRIDPDKMVPDNLLGV